MRKITTANPTFGLVMISTMVLILLTPSWAPAQTDAPTLSILRLESSLKDQTRADFVTRTLTELLGELTDVKVFDRTDVMMGDMLLVHGCDNDSLDCLAAVAQDFQTQQVLYGKVEPFADDIMVTLRVYDSLTNKLRPVYSRKIPEAELQNTLKSDLTDLLSGTLWELPAYVSVTTPDIKDARVTVDGAPVGNAPVSRVRVQPGERVVRVLKDGYQTWEETHDLTSGQSLDLEVVLKPGSGDDGKEIVIKGPGDDEKGSGPPGEIPEDEGYYQPPVAAWIVLGIGGAALAGGTVTGVLTLQKLDEFEGEDRQRQARDLKSEGEDLALATNVLLGVGAAAVVTSALMFVFMGDYVTPSDDATVQITPTPIPGGGLMELEVRF